METTSCPTCGAVAEIVNRDVREYEEEFTTSVDGEPVVAWLPGFMEFVTVRCLGNRSHMYSGPVFAVLGRGEGTEGGGNTNVQSVRGGE